MSNVRTWLDGTAARLAAVLTPGGRSGPGKATAGEGAAEPYAEPYALAGRLSEAEWRQLELRVLMSSWM